MFSSGITLITRATVHASSGIQWGDVSTWATAGVALLALIAAVWAYRKQAKSVEHQAEQLRLQGVALVDQQKANALQGKVLEAQLREMAQSAEAFERQQADAVTVKADSWNGSVPGVRYGDSVHIAVVSNGFHRPIRNVACCIQRSLDDSLNPARLVARVIKEWPTRESDELTRKLTGYPAQPHDVFVDESDDSKVSLVPASARAVFIFIYDVPGHPDARITARFTDDAGLHWQIDHDLHLEKLDNRDDW